MMKITIILVLAVVRAQWAYLGGGKDANDPGKTSGPSLWPSARYGAGFSYKNNQLFLFGGISGTDAKNDLWLLDLVTESWKRLGPLDSSFISGSLIDKGKFSQFNWPPMLVCVSMFYVKDTLYLFPSYNLQDYYYSNFFIYNLTSSLWYYDIIENDLKINMIVPFFLFSSYFDYKSNSFYLVGGGEFVLIANMTTLGLTIDSKGKLENLHGYSLSTIDEEQKKIFLFGGYRFNYTMHNNIFSYDIETGSQEQLDLFNVTNLTPSFVYSHGLSGIFSDSYFPSVRILGSFCLDKKQNRFILFGGLDYGSSLSYSDLWLFHIDLRNWAYISGPTTPGSSSNFGKKGFPSVDSNPNQRFRNVFFYDEEDEIFYIFGGSYYINGKEYELNDLWAFYFLNQNIRISTATFKSNLQPSYSRSSILDTEESHTQENSSTYTYIKFVIIVASSFLILVLIAYSIRRFKYTNLIYEPDLSPDLNMLKSMTTVTTSMTGDNEKTAYSDELIETLSIPAFKECTFKDFKISKYLTRGSMGKICLAKGFKQEFLKQGNSEDLIIIKLIGDLDSNPSSEQHKAFIQEVAIMEMLSHFPYIVKLLGFCDKPMCIVMKYYMNGSLSSLLKSTVKFSVRRKVDMILDISKGLNIIHDHDVVHCDMKGDNVLLEYDENLRRLVCYITDFGICRIISSKSLKVQTFQVSDMKGFSYNYAAPEVFLHRVNISAVTKTRDIYSFGVLMLEVLTRIKPWN